MSWNFTEHTLHTDKDGDVFTVDMWNDGEHELRVTETEWATVIATTDQLRSIAAKLVALADQWDAEHPPP